MQLMNPREQKVREQMADDFSGVWTAIVTPFTAAGEVDLKCYERLLARQVEAGVTGIVVCGTTGEAPTLTIEEKLSLIRRSRGLLPPHIRLMAGTGGSCTRQSIELSKLAEESGCDSLLIVTPPYNKPSIRGLMEHFRKIGEAVAVPLCLYHVPSRTAQLLSTAQMAEILSLPQVQCVKEASADLNLFSTFVRGTKKPFLSGDDPTFLPSLAIGAKGIVSVTSNLFPKAFVEMTASYVAGDVKRALDIHQKLMPLVTAMFCEVNPCPLKAALSIMGLAENSVRAPLTQVTAESYGVISAALESSSKSLQELT
jgi:4-hydroxy-tetrahydrodipicolinate synthase